MSAHAWQTAARTPPRRHRSPAARFIILNAQFLVFNTRFLVFNSKVLVFNAKFIIFTHQRPAHEEHGRYLKLQNNRPFSVEKHHFSGAILHSFCIFRRKNAGKSAFILQFATAGTPCDRKRPLFLQLNHIVMRSSACVDAPTLPRRRSPWRRCRARGTSGGAPRTHTGAAWHRCAPRHPTHPSGKISFFEWKNLHFRLENH